MTVHISAVTFKNIKCMGVIIISILKPDFIGSPSIVVKDRHFNLPMWVGPHKVLTIALRDELSSETCASNTSRP